MTPKVKDYKGTTHRVTVQPDSFLKYPELWCHVYIAGDDHERRAFSEMLMRARCWRTDDVDKADIVIFTGGPDVNPIFYDETPHPSVTWNSKRDEEDIKLFEKCLKGGIPMVGICRGAQFGHVMRGGKLYQDVDNHYGDHSIWDRDKNTSVMKTSSVHHQMVIEDKALGMHVIADNGKANVRWLNDKECDTKPHVDVEAFFYRDICFLGFQGHPEYKGYNDYQKWCLDKINEYICQSVDTEVTRPIEDSTESILRLKESIILEREMMWKNDIKAEVN